MQLVENLLFAGRYLLKKPLGRGGFSEVWLANDQWTSLDVAVKVYAPGQGMDDDGLKDFSKELANVYNLNHTNLLKPQHVDSWAGMPYLIMAFCENGSCYKYVGKLTEDEAWKLISDVASGLAYLHSQEVIHQDIKPDNILIDSNGNYLITDFGISVQARSTLRKSVSNATGSGTTAYMAPERFSRDPQPIKASDIWSLGATLYELVTGRMPFGEVGGGMQRSGAGIPTIETPISATLRQTIIRMLAEDPWQRPTASLLADWAQNPAAISLISEEELEQKSGNTFLKVNPSKIEASPAGEDVQIYIKSDNKWRCFSEQPKWCVAEKKNAETISVKIKPNQTGEERKTCVNVIAGSRASIVTVSQASLPKKKTALLVVIVSIIVILAAISAWIFRGPDEGSDLMCITHDKCAKDFDLWNSKINDENKVADKDVVKAAFVKLQELEKIENNPKYKCNHDFPFKLNEFKNNLEKASKSIQNDLYEFRSKWKGSDSDFNNDVYVRFMNEKKNRVDLVLKRIKGGTLKNSSIRDL